MPMFRPDKDVIAASVSAASVSAASVSTASVSTRQGSGFVSRLCFRFWCSLLLCGLFLQWLEPIRLFGENEGMAYHGLLTVLTAVILLTGSLGLPVWMTSVLSFVALCQAMVYLHGDGQGWFWLKDYAPDLLNDVSVWADTGSMSAISGASRELVLLTGWILLLLSVQLLAVSRYTVLLFLCITAVYLFAFELSSGLSLFWPIVRAAGLGLLLQFSVVFARYNTAGSIGGDSASDSDADSYSDSLPREDRRQTPWQLRTTAAVGLFIIAFGVASSTAAALLLPVKPAKAIDWDQAFSSMEVWRDNEDGNSGTAVTGYKGGSEQLGKPLQLRDEVYFTGHTSIRTYWKGETLSFYDGHGWSQPEEETEEEMEAWGTPPSGNTGSVQSFIQTVTFEEPQHGLIPVFSGGQLLEVQQVKTGEPFSSSPQSPAYTLLKDAFSGATYVKPAPGIGAVYGYEIRSAPISGGAPSDEEDSSAGEHIDPSEIRYRYLQLPAALPASVRELGHELVSGTANRLEAAKSVEAYLKSNYQYTLDTSVPEGGQDFVEDFLFRQRAGYCDHFSTAMVILLRTQGIPARWVKGFAPGESDDSGTYTVRYADAHSWVEVYFPGQGWQSFEPTPGFQSESGQTRADSAGSLSVLPENTFSFLDGKGILQLGPLFRQAAVLLTEGFLQTRQWTQQVSLKYKPGTYAILGVIALLLGTSAAVFFSRLIRLTRNKAPDRKFGKNRQLPKGVGKAIQRHFPGKVELLRAADSAWAGLNRHYGTLGTGATAREYTEALKQRMDEPGIADMERFMRVWEPLYYGGDLPDRQTTISFLDSCRKLSSL